MKKGRDMESMKKKCYGKMCGENKNYKKKKMMEEEK